MGKDFKNILQQIEQVHLKTFVKISVFKSKEGLSHLATTRRGMYWLWTSLTLEELKRLPHNDLKKRHVPIAKRILQREGLSHICKITRNNYRIVYNGVGGYRTTDKGFGLRERILQEITCNDARTGTLNISYGCRDLSKWAVTFFDFDDPQNSSILKQLGTNAPYVDYAEVLEDLCRMEFGTPILCRN
ncbi:hypothetical protein [Winogradskyella pulchriflava]|uniref:Uncharacterized protein n=1 Tax=Winogradskyella pulchriflava TaxID=1110688 RepID=A0ABV6Q7M5_9FLAO